MFNRFYQSIGKQWLLSILISSIAGPVAAAPGNPIPLENQMPGTDEWRIGDRAEGYSYSDDQDGEIAGYVDQPSVNLGDNIAFKISVNPPRNYRIDFYRLGYYGGAGGRLVLGIPARSGITQTPCNVNATTGMVECKWNTSYTLHVPEHWVSGIYMAVLTTEDNKYRRITFVVRNDDRVADFIYQQPIFTYHAYNCYPCNSYGKSLYDENSSTDITTVAGSERAVKISMDRPVVDQYGHGFNPDDDEHWELFLVRWLEKEGYDINYSTDLDTHTRGSHLLSYKGFISGGHDAYWTTNMLNAVERARDRGLNLAFFGAGTAYWQIRLEPASNGIGNRVITCYKNAKKDPTRELRKKTIPWRELGRPEQTLIGVQYAAKTSAINETYPFVMKVFDQGSSNANLSWVFNDVDLTDHRMISGLIGYGVDRQSPEYPLPYSRVQFILGHSPLATSDHHVAYSDASLYQAPSGAWVFASGTLSWSWGLGRTGMENSQIQHLTRNILNQMSIGR